MCAHVCVCVNMCVCVCVNVCVRMECARGYDTVVDVHRLWSTTDYSCMNVCNSRPSSDWK